MEYLSKTDFLLAGFIFLLNRITVNPINGITKYSMKYLSGVAILFFATQAEASWSAFAHVTPYTQEKYKLDVSITPVEDVENKFLIRFKAVEYDFKLAWLIVSADALSEKGQVLRDYIWSASKTEKEILIKSKLMPTGIGGFIPQNMKNKHFYEVELDAEIIKRAYIYIDFPSVVMDGGLYYSVDLGSYLTKFQKINKSLLEKNDAE